MNAARLAGLVAAAWLAAGPSEALAQATSRPFRRGAVELDVLGGWQTQSSLGARRAPLTGNQGTPVVGLFDTSSEIEAGPSVDARLGVHLTRVFEIEGGVRVARPRLATRLTNDFEDAADVTATQTFTHLAFELNGVFHLTALRAGSVLPFVTVGAGYLRELHNGREVVETGQSGQAGGGIKVLLSRSRRGLVRTVGLRADARFYVRRGGIEIDEDEPLRTYASAAAGLVVGF
jgi:hypothetical protein